MNSFLEEIVGSKNLYVNENMSHHTTFKTGGMADFFVLPSNAGQIKDIINLCRTQNVPFYIIGRGSNIIAPDEGLRGVVICIGENMADIKVEGESIVAGAGASLAKIANVAMKHTLTGFEFAAGIPGSLGGAVTMNAGAYGGEMKNILDNVRLMDYDGCEKIYKNEEMNFGYRHSILMEKELVVIEATMKLEAGDGETIKETMRDFADRRISKQPLEYPSAGSTFKRPEGYFAGKLIEDAGLAGYTIGGAEVSKKHCGFIINKGNATTTDILELIDFVIEKVYHIHGVKIEPEVRLLGSKLK